MASQHLSAHIVARRWPARVSSLKAHMRLHTGELFECPFCLWKGNTKKKLKEHKGKRHKQELEDELAQESLNT